MLISSQSPIIIIIIICIVLYCSLFFRIHFRFVHIDRMPEVLLLLLLLLLLILRRT